MTGTTPPGGTNEAVTDVMVRLRSDEARAAFLGRECAMIWFASQTKIFNEKELEKDILLASLLAKALGVQYTEDQFRNAFKTENKVASDFDSLFSETIAKQKNTKIRDIYLFSFWCTASRAFVSVVPLFEPEQQKIARKWVESPLSKAAQVASAHDPASSLRCEKLETRSSITPLDTFDLADKLASEITEVQKEFLLKFMAPQEVALVTEPLLKKKP